MAKEPEVVAVVTAPETAELVAPETVAAEVLRDYWLSDGDEGRVRAGSVVQVTKDELIAGLEAGVLKKASK